MANRAFIRVDDVDADNAAVVDWSYAILTAKESGSGETASLTLGFAAADDPAAPADIDGLNALVMTTATVTWAPGAWVGGVQYQTPDLSAPLQEVFDRPGWGSGQALILLIDDNSSDTNAYRKFSSVDYDSGSEKPEIHFGLAD